MKDISAFARIPLAALPTPLYKLQNISEQLGRNIYIKRDDMTGVALGGNKVRKLEYLLADAKARGVDVVFTTGGAQSNHAMLTAACALRLGMEPVLVLKKRGVWERKGNQLLNSLMGVEVHLVDSDSYRDVYAEMDRLAAEREAKGQTTYKIPVGGSVALGSLGYVNCMKEVAEQCAALGMKPDRIVCTTGSGGTHAGTALGARIFLPGTKVTGMMVDDSDFQRIVPKLMRATAELLDYDEPIRDEDVELRAAFGAGYAIPSEAGNAAIRCLARSEGIFIDPVYTGKAFGELLKMAGEGALEGEENIIFLHTGGAGGLFAIDV